MIVLDTHAWIWWVTGSKRLKPALQRKIARTKRVGVPAISCWEVAMLVTRGRLRFDRDPAAWIELALQVPSTELLPLEPAIAVGAARLATFGGDPADHIIIATARHWAAPLATADERIHDSGLVQVLW